MHPHSAERIHADALRRLTENVDGIRRRVAAARARSPRSARGEVTLVVVTKAAPPAGLDLLSRAGVADIGENRVLDAAAKRAAAPAGLRWHGIGHLQTNKARKAVEAFDVVHALDSLHLADRLEAVLAERGHPLPVYAQVNAAGDPAKSGVAVSDALTFLSALADRPHLEVVGLMTMARAGDDAEAARPAFAALRELRDDAERRGIGRVPAAGLSMGMSDDFEAAVEEGATCVRVGRAAWDGVFAEAAAPSPAGSPSPVPRGRA